MRSSLLLTTLAFALAACAGCSSAKPGGLDRSEYALNVCTNGSWDPLRGVTLADPARYAQLDVATSGTIGTTRGAATSHVGTPCTTAPDVAACTKAIDDATTSASTWTKQTCGGAGCSTYSYFFVTEKAGVVTTIASQSDLVALILPVDSPAEAALVASFAVDVEGIDCNGPQIATHADGSYDVFLAHGGGCNGDRQEKRVHVMPDGTTTTTESATIPGDSSCPEQA
jgi:hypothetical protein